MNEKTENFRGLPRAQQVSIYGILHDSQGPKIRQKMA